MPGEGLWGRDSPPGQPQPDDLAKPTAIPGAGRAVSRGRDGRARDRHVITEDPYGDCGADQAARSSEAAVPLPDKPARIDPPVRLEGAYRPQRPVRLLSRRGDVKAARHPGFVWFPL